MSTDSTADGGSTAAPPPESRGASATGSEATAASFDWLTLDPDEEVVWADTPHELSLVPAFIVGIPLSFVLVGIPILIGSYLSYKNTNYVVTSEALYKKTGILSRDVQRIEFDKVQNTSYRQGAVGASLGYGTVDISTAGGSGIEMRFSSVAEPQDVQTRINERIRHRRGSDAHTEDGAGGAPTQKADVLDEILTELRAIRTAVEEDVTTGRGTDDAVAGVRDRTEGRDVSDHADRTNGDPDDR